MTTTVTFDNATFADAISRANTVAPKKGAALDKAQGIIIKVDSADEVYIRSTDLDVTYEQRISAVKLKGGPVAWRVPSALINGIASSLNLGEGRTVDLIDQSDPFVRIKSDKMFTKLITVTNDDYPESLFKPFLNPDTMTKAQELATKVQQVSWACDNKSPILGGVHINGTELIGCDNGSGIVALVDCRVDVENAITVPLRTLASLLKNATDVRIAATEQVLQLHLDAETRATSTLLEGEYPNVRMAMRDNFLGTVKIDRIAFVETLQQILVLTKDQKFPKLSVEVNATSLIPMLTFDMEAVEMGRIRNSMDVAVEGEFGDVCRFNVPPSRFLAAADNAKSDYIYLSFGHPTAPVATIRFHNDSGYQCHMTTLRDT